MGGLTVAGTIPVDIGRLALVVAMISITAIGGMTVAGAIPVGVTRLAIVGAMITITAIGGVTVARVLSMAIAHCVRACKTICSASCSDMTWSLLKARPVQANPRKYRSC